MAYYIETTFVKNSSNEPTGDFYVEVRTKPTKRSKKEEYSGHIDINTLENFELHTSSIYASDECKAAIEQKVRAYVINHFWQMFSFGVKMTHNEYQYFLQVCANRYVNDPFFTAEELDTYAKKPVILPFDLTKYNLDQISENIINERFQTIGFVDDDKMLLTGHFPVGKLHTIAFSLDCEEGFVRSANGFYFNPEKLMILSFVENDIFLTLCENEKTYREQLAEDIEYHFKNDGVKLNINDYL